MPADLFYTSGQAARELGVSQAAIRALCSAGAIECETTAGGQYRIPKSVVEKPGTLPGSRRAFQKPLPAGPPQALDFSTRRAGNSQRLGRPL